MSSHPIRIDALPEPHLQNIREFLLLDEFLESDEGTRARWFTYVADTERSLCKLYKQEPSTPGLRDAIAIGVGFSEEFRRFVFDRAPADAQAPGRYAEFVCAGAGTLINQCSDRRKEEGGDVALSR